MVILVGEARDAETIIAVLDAAMTGHLVYTTSHTNPDSSGVGESVAKGMKRARIAVRSTTSHRSKDQCGSNSGKYNCGSAYPHPRRIKQERS